MFYCVLAILAGFFVALSDALNKKFFASKGFPYMAVARSLPPVLFLIPVLFWRISSYQIPHIPTEFLPVVCILLILELVATLLYMKGVEVSPLSLSIPFLSFTPVFIVFTGYVLLGEKVSITGLIGILLIVAGSYLINLPEAKKGILAPIKAIKKEKGSLYLLEVAIIYSVTSVLGKKGLLLTDPVLFVSFYFSIFGIFATLSIKLLYKISLKELFTNLKGCFLVGGTQTIMFFCHMFALEHLETAYMIAFKRTSILFAVILGYIMFKEKHLLIRLSSVILMLTGIIILSFWR